MNKVILLILAFLSLNANAIKSHLTCSKNGTDIYFINGVDVGDESYKDFVRTVALLEQSSPLHEFDPKAENVKFIPLHNSSQGMKKDVAEAMFQYIENVKKEKKNVTIVAAKFVFHFLSSNTQKMKEVCNRELGQNLRYICDELLRIKYDKYNSHLFKDLGSFKLRIAESVAANKKIVIIGHSQGAMFADSLRTFIKNKYPGHDQYTSSFLIGAFKLSSHKRAYYYNYTDDGVIKKIRSLLVIIPEQRYRITTTCEAESEPQEGEFSFQAKNHSFDCYTGGYQVNGPKFLLESSRENVTAREYFYDLLKKAVSEHGNNDKDCCNKEAGKLERTDLNSPVSELFIGDKVKLNDGLQLSHNEKSEICGASELTGTVSLTRSSLRDTVVTAANNNGVILIDSKTSHGTKILGNLIVRNARVKSGEFFGSHRPGHVYSEIAYGDFEGANNFSGYFIVRGSTNNSTVAGQSLLMTNYGNPHFTLTVESLPNSGVRDGIDVSGIGYINATVGRKSKIHGTPLLRDITCPGCGNWFGGIITHSANTEISSDLINPSSSRTEVRGGIFLGKNVKIRNGSFVVGAGMRLDKGVPAIHLNSVIDNSIINGGFYITSAQVTAGSNVTGTPYICTSALTGATVSDNAVTCAGSYTGSYGLNWICYSEDENGNSSFPSQCNIDDQTMRDAGKSLSVMEEEDMIRVASIIQQRSQELTYAEAALTMENLGL